MRHDAMRSGYLAVLGLAMGAATASAQPAFSVSPAGPSGLSPAGIYTPSGGGPMFIGGGAGIGAGDPADDLDGFSTSSDEDDFTICGSVDPLTVGSGGPEGPLPPYNVFEQALKRQHAADAYIGSEAYNRFTGILPAPISTGLNTNFMTANQSPLYFMDFGLLPLGGPDVFHPVGTPADDVDGLEHFKAGVPQSIYFTLSRQSPSLNQIAGGVGDSGADIFFDVDFNLGGTESLFASQEQLGLQPLDDIDGLKIWDALNDGIFNENDTILFSLTRDSPTLAAAGLSPADIIAVTFGQVPFVLMHFNEFGLLFGDDIDAFTIDPLINNSALATILANTPSPSAMSLLVLAAVGAARRRRSENRPPRWPEGRF